MKISKKNRSHAAALMAFMLAYNGGSVAKLQQYAVEAGIEVAMRENREQRRKARRRYK